MTNKFNVGDKVVFNKQNGHIAERYGFEINKAYEVQEVVTNFGTIRVINELGEMKIFDEERFELAENQRITALEETVAKQGEEIEELKLIVAQLRKPSTVVEEALSAAPTFEELMEEGRMVLANDVIEFEGKQYKKVDREAREGDVVVIKSQSALTDAFKTGKPYKVLNQARIESDNPVHGRNLYNVYGSSTGRSPETVAVYELIVEDIPFFVPKPAKTANQLRAEIIEKAKGFVDENSISRNDAKTNKFVSVDFWKTYIEFVVNVEKNTVVALAKGLTTHHVIARGIAKCAPGDVFNEHIGKAIALGRALGLDVSEFEQAVQPTEVVVGTYTYHYKNGELSFEHTVVDEEDAKETNAEQNSCGWTFKIINDTNAQYGGVE